MRLDDGVLLQSVANGLFLHADSLRFDTGSLEVNGAAMGSPFTLTLFRSAAEAQAGELRAGELVRMRSACADALVQADLEHAAAVAALVDAADDDGAGAGTAAADAAVVTVEAGVPLVDELRAVVGPQPSDEALSSLLSEHGGDVRAAASAWFGAGVATTADEAAARVAPSSAARAYLQPPTGPISSRALWLLEDAESRGTRGGILSNGSVVRLLHASTGLYLCVRPRRGAAASASRLLAARGLGGAADGGGGSNDDDDDDAWGEFVAEFEENVAGGFAEIGEAATGVAAAAAEALGALVPDFSLENVFEPKGVGRPEPRPWFADAPADAAAGADADARAAGDAAAGASVKFDGTLRGVDAWLAGGGASTPRGAEPTAAVLEGWLRKRSVSGGLATWRRRVIVLTPERSRHRTDDRPLQPAGGCPSTAPSGRARAPSRSSLPPRSDRRDARLALETESTAQRDPGTRCQRSDWRRRSRAVSRVSTTREPPAPWRPSACARTAAGRRARLSPRPPPLLSAAPPSRAGSRGGARGGPAAARAPRRGGADSTSGGAGGGAGGGGGRGPRLVRPASGGGARRR